MTEAGALRPAEPAPASAASPSAALPSASTSPVATPPRPSAPLRRKLLALGLLPLGITLPVLAAVLLWWTQIAFDRLLATKVRSDLAVAQGYFDKLLGDIGSGTAAVAGSHALHRALAARDGPAIQALLARDAQREQLDFMLLVDSTGRPVASARSLAPAEHRGGPPAGRPAAAQPLPSTNPPSASQQPSGLLDADLPLRLPGSGASVEILGPEALARLAPELRERVAVPLLPTRNARPSSRTVEDRALVVLARAPVLDDQGHAQGELWAGLMLNRNLGFIDHLNEIVYPEGALPFGSVGTATVFLDDVRVSTNVRLFGPEGEKRAIGTRVSQAVHDMVLGQGRTWLDRAFVVDDWYVSGYLPLRNGVGDRVGMLYVGFLETPFTWVRNAVLAVILAVCLAAMGLAAWASLRGARSLARPIERMSATMDRIRAGELTARVGRVETGDEIGQLARHLDGLLQVIEDNTAALQRWGEELDRKVAERTAALEATQAQLVQREKLAAIGQLTAGVAHEVNNPIAVIQGHLDLLREMLAAPRGSATRAELDLIDQQIERMRLIVTRLLQFARPGEYAPESQPVDTQALLQDCEVLVRHVLAKAGVRLHLDLQASRQPLANRQDLQQVLVNLMVNACQAMPDGGELQVSSRDHEGHTEIAVADTGPGLSPEQAAEAFRPFVTYRKDGTGLGLWISRQIIERHGGSLQLQPRPDGRHGAMFVIRLG